LRKLGKLSAETLLSNALRGGVRGAFWLFRMEPASGFELLTRPLTRSVRSSRPVPVCLIPAGSLVAGVRLDVAQFLSVLARERHVGRGLSRVGAADRVATPKALLTGSGKTPQFQAGAWGAHFSPKPAGDIL
jgi:hypothetical protein